jgi:ferrous iron transport protein B
MSKECCETEDAVSSKAPCDQRIALLGNPNAGKTTLFNLLTGARQRTGNWPGVTIERKTGQCRLQDQNLDIIDLPGTYSLDFSDTSSDELIARQFVQKNPDVLYLNIVDANTLERGLYLTLQLREMGVPMIVLLNMMDVAEQRGMVIDIEGLQQQLDCPVVAVSLRSNNAFAQLEQPICAYRNTQKPAFKLDYHASVETALSQLQQQNDWSRQQALQALQVTQNDAGITTMREQIEADTDEEFDFLLADARFDQATKTAAQHTHERGKISRTNSDAMDRWVLGRWTGVPVFLLMMYLLFFFSINLGGAFIDVFDLGAQAIFVDASRQLFESMHFPQWLIAFLSDGVGGGLQVVATFIPVIGALYLFLTLLEESGYMSRAAFVMDQLMRKLGVSGKAIVPLIVGFGCNVPSIMSTRTLDTPRERIMTVLMAPFMSCGARLAVYALFAAAFFKTAGHNIVFLLYLVGIAFAVLTALIMRKTLLQGGAGHFVMEMPTYQWPQLRNVLLNTWSKLKGFVKDAGKIIVIMVAVINVMNSLGTDGSYGNQDSEKSVLSATAKIITPVFAPMGIEQDNWPATVGIMSGVLAKEVVVGTLDALYSQIDQQAATDATTEAPVAEPYSLITGLSGALATIPENLIGLKDTLLDPLGFSAISEDQEVQDETFVAMQNRFDGAIGAFAYLLFILMYFPCVAATSAMHREIGTRWTILGIAWSTGLGYGAAVLFYQLATIAHHPAQSLLWSAAVLTVFGLAVYAFYRVGNKPDSHSGLSLKVS